MEKKKIIVLVVSLITLVTIIFTVFIVVKSKDKGVYSVTFDSNGGSLIEKQRIKKGKRIEKPSTPIRDGYVFLEWTYQGKSYDFKKSVTSDMILEAKWEFQKFTIKFDSDGGSNIDEQILEKGNKIIKPDNPTKDGYKFAYWMLEDKEYDFNKDVEENITLKAKWETIEVPSENNNSQNNSSIYPLELTINCTIHFEDPYNDMYGAGTVPLPDDQLIKVKVYFPSAGVYPDITPLTNIVKPQDPYFNTRPDLKFIKWTHYGNTFDFNNPDVRSCYYSEPHVLVISPYWD